MNRLEEVKLCEIREVWESYSGWYWFVTEYHDHEIAFGLVRGFETEWGYFSLKELKELASRSRVWKLPRRNWAFCPCVVPDGAASCSSGSAGLLGTRPALPRRGERDHKEVGR